MKNAKRLLSLLLVLAMVACLSMTAFADGVGTATINIVVGNKTTTITGNAGSKLSDVLDANVRTIGKTKWTTVTDWYDASVTHKALTGIGSNVSKPGTTADLVGDKYANVKETDVVAGHPGYYLMDSDGNSYHYVYVGYDWTYTSTTVGGGDLYTYMCCYTLTAGETVTITYSLQITDWTQTGAIQ